MGLADNYTLQNTNLFDAFFSPINQWQTMQQNNQVLEQNRIANQAAQQKADYLKQAQQEAQTLDYNDPNAIHKFIAKYEPTGLTKGMTNYVANLDAKKRQGMLTDASKYIALVKNGDPAKAAEFLRGQALAYKNSGDEQTAAEYEKRASLTESNPTAALQFTQMDYATLLPKDAAGSYKDYMEANAPQVKDINTGGSTGVWIRDPNTGKVAYQKLTDNTVSPDEKLKSETQIKTTGMNNDTSRFVSNNTLKGTMYSSDKSYQGTVYSSNEATKRNDATIAWQKQQEFIKQNQGQPFTGTSGYKMVYYPALHRAEYVLDKQGNKVMDGSVVSPSAAANKPMPASALTLISNSRDKLQSSQNTIAKIDQSLKDLDTKQGGKLQLGLLSNAGNVASNLFSKGDESSLAYERLRSNINGMVNEVLQMAKGTQTEGDAQRAAKVILSTPLTDNNAVINALSELRRVANKTVALEQGKIEEVYQNYGKTPPNDLYASTQPTTAKPQQQASKPTSNQRSYADRKYNGG